MAKIKLYCERKARLKGINFLPSFSCQRKIISKRIHLLFKALLWASFILLLLRTQAFSEERVKSLKEILVQKGVLSKEEAAALREISFSAGVNRSQWSKGFRLRQESFLEDTGIGPQSSTFSSPDGD